MDEIYDDKFIKYICYLRNTFTFLIGEHFISEMIQMIEEVLKVTRRCDVMLQSNTARQLLQGDFGKIAKPTIHMDNLASSSTIEVIVLI